MVLAELRARTSGLHERAERAVDLPRRVRTPDAYAAFLGRLFGFHDPLELRLTRAACGRVGLDLAERRKAHLLAADLAALGWTAAAVRSLPRCGELPAVGSAADVFGCLYVLEGATLGGQFIRREVGRALGLTPARGCSFFASYGDRVGAMWAAFGAALAAFAATPEARGAVVRAAADTFAAFERWVSDGPG